MRKENIFENSVNNNKDNNSLKWFKKKKNRIYEES